MSIPYAPMPTHLETERLRLEHWTDGDAEDLCLLVAERGAATAPRVERAREILAEGRAATATTGLALLRVTRLAEGDFIGYCGLVVGRTTVDEPEIAYELLRSSHGHGYATEAARAVLDAATATGRRRLWSTVRPWNAPSFRVLAKLGFERDRVSKEESGELVWLTRALP
ncbi:GNAT family N-acetyltransferase [Streptacidiphilus neutrinimicus]|uniref:GNAT family N-acetyltransferase n=1 Tax=Streptacidiphilus neutrinimicus TaxID=105420 RepID=UPI0005A83FD8|nr:GNAT family N-acetyltransferase [Streptacidiphilus neutrinimicus]